MRKMRLMQNRYFKFLMYLGVWLGLNILWGLRSAILYSGVSFPTMFMGMMALSFAPIIGVTILLLMTLFRSRKLNLVALIWMILASVTSMPPIYLLSVSMFSVVSVLVCDTYLAVIICNRDRPVKAVNQVALGLIVIFVLCLLSPEISARFAINGYSDPNTAIKTGVQLTSKNNDALQTNGLTTVTPRRPNVEISGVGNINIKIQRIGVFYFSTVGNYSYDW